MVKKVFQESYMNDPVFRHIAGEGWHPDGLNMTVLGALAFEQKLIEEVGDRDADPSVPQNIRQIQISQSRYVEELRAEHGLRDMPPLPPDQE